MPAEVVRHGRMSGTLTAAAGEGGGVVAVVAVRSASVQALLDVAVPVLLAVLTLDQLLTDRTAGRTPPS